MEYKKDDLINFLIRAKKNTYAGHGVERKFSCRPSSHDFNYEEGDYLYIDSYLGGYNFTGEEAVWHKYKPMWSMNYSGKVFDSENFNGEFLKEALMLVPKDMPFRGPKKYNNGDYEYICEVEGDFDWFHGVEKITREGKEVYRLYFHGGLVS